MGDRVSRKGFVALVGTVAAAETAGFAGAEAATTQVQRHAPPAQKPLGAEPEGYAFFTLPEAAFIEAAVERLIPTDSLGPGARAAGVAYYIDRQLDGQYGYGAKMYMQGPFLQALPTQGYQLPLIPRQVYRLGVAETNAYAKKQYGKTFDRLSSPAHQDAVLAALDKSTATFASVPAKTFFEMLLANTIEGFFSDPMYGGNRNKTGWRLVGFPGAAAAYISFIEQHNKPYTITPAGIADLQQAEQAMDAQMQADEHGSMDMAVHEALAKKALGVH